MAMLTRLGNQLNGPFFTMVTSKNIQQSFVIWVWINTYENTISRGLFTSINPSYFDVNYRGTKGFDTRPFVIYQCVITVITVYQNFKKRPVFVWGVAHSTTVFYPAVAELGKLSESCPVDGATTCFVEPRAPWTGDGSALRCLEDAGSWIWLPTMFLVFYTISLRLFKESSQPPIMRGLFLCVCMCTVYRYTRARSRIRRSNINTSTCSLGLLKIVCCPFHHCFELLPFWRDKFSLHSLKSPISMFHRVGIDTYCADGILELISILQLCSQGHRFSRAQDSSSSNVLPSSGVATHFFALKSAESSALGIRQQGNPPEKF